MKLAAYLFLGLMVNLSVMGQSRGTTTSATAALGRKLPEPSDVGPPRKDKFVGLFYWTWHTQPGLKNPPLNTTEYLARDPTAVEDYHNAIWSDAGGPWFWSEPLFGY